ncbi:MAG: tetratricopeptide repeat protein [Leptolinea sp.]|jgi:tetratricopeptide (TPR) repeat protein|nr:tetratricopeptide repeat protein [Leptolinea sp.]
MRILQRISLICLTALWGFLFLRDWQIGQKLLQADQMLAARQPDSAESLFRQVEKDEPWRRVAWTDLARQYLARHDNAKALQILEQADLSGKLASEGYLLMEQIYRQNGSVEKIEPALVKACSLADTPDDQSVAIQELIHFYRSEFRFTEAQQKQQLLTRISKQPDSSRREEILLETILDLETGLANWRALEDKPAWFQEWGQKMTAAAAEPDEARRWMLIGQAYGAAGVWDLAEYAFTCAADTSPGYAEAWAWLAEAHQQQGKDGKQAIERALELAPNSPAIRLLGALYFRRQADYIKAGDLLRRNIIEQPNDSLWQLELGHTMAEAGRFEEAIQAYQQVIQMTPSEITGYSAVVEMCARNEYRLEDVGLPAAREAAALFPDDPEAHDLLGQVFFGMGKTEQANEAFRATLDLNVEYYPTWLHLAQMALANQDSATAREALEKTMKLAPDSVEGRLAARLWNQYFPGLTP